jgi:hypothetical protein
MTKLRLIAAFLVTVALAGCGSMSYLTVASQRGGQTIAVVSLAVSEFGGRIRTWNAVHNTPFMTGYAAQMVGIVEQNLASNYQVVPIDSFVAEEAYQSLAQNRPYAALPDFGGYEMPFFGYHRKHLATAQVAPEMAQALAQAVGTDLIAVVLAEWGAKTGGVVPTSKALARTTLTVYDASGARIYRGRKQAMGSRTLGAFGHVVVDENSITEWVDAFARTVELLVSR